jgi:hypothetical protein
MKMYEPKEVNVSITWEKFHFINVTLKTILIHNQKLLTVGKIKEKTCGAENIKTGVK